MTKYPYNTNFAEILSNNDVDTAFDIDTDTYYDVVLTKVPDPVVKIHDRERGWEFGLTDMLTVEKYYDGGILVINRIGARSLRFILSKTVEIRL